MSTQAIISADSPFVERSEAWAERIDMALDKVGLSACTRRLEQVLNFRDIGGHVTADGSRVRTSQVYRSGHLGDASERDLRRSRCERFRDSDALILHGQNMAPLMDAIMATANVSGELLGDPNEHLRAQLADSPVGLFALYQSL